MANTIIVTFHRQPENISALRHRRATGIFSLMWGSGSASDAKIERKVSASARNFFDGVQKIIAAAKRAEELLIDILSLCTNITEQEEKPSELDILLKNANCAKFVIQCLEKELSPNLIHCLRLVRVLELENADTAINDNSNETSTRPI